MYWIELRVCLSVNNLFFSCIQNRVWREQVSLQGQFTTASHYGVRSLQTHVQILFLDYQFIMLVTNFNTLTPNDPYSGRTAPLTSKSCILIFI